MIVLLTAVAAFMVAQPQPSPSHVPGVPYGVVVPGATPSPAPSAIPSPAPAPALAPCDRVTAKLLGTIDTKIVSAGAKFAFATVTEASYDGKDIPLGTQGVGIVATMDHSKSQGHSGYLVLEARYLELADGSHVPVTFVPGRDGHSDAFIRAGSSDAPGLLGYIPYVSDGASVYDYFHHGKDAAVVAGAPLVLVLGDGMFGGTCSVRVR